MIGEITISFNAWEEWRADLVPEIEKRGLSITLSGHCLRMFIPKSRFKARPEWFAEIKGARTEKGQYCFSNPSFRRALSSKIMAFLKGDPIVRRLSIWAEDTALVCECAACGRRGFLRSFVECIDEVARVVRKRLPRVAIDFLAYNAALAWKMLEPGRGLKFSNCSTEIAYWGRDYRFGLKNSRQAADRRAERCLQTMEKTPAIISSFNQTLFRLRFVDIWTRDATPKEGGIHQRRDNKTARHLLEKALDMTECVLKPEQKICKRWIRAIQTGYFTK